MMMTEREARLSVRDREALIKWRALPPITMTLQQFKELPEYSMTQPTGVKVGKMWRRWDGCFAAPGILERREPLWMIGRYEEAPDGYIMTNMMINSAGYVKSISEMSAEENVRSHRLYKRIPMAHCFLPACH